MTPPLPSRSRLPELARGVLLVAIGVVGLWLLGRHFELTLEKNYSVDEFQYAHGGWLISQGKVIYRDFFEHHFPLIHQLLAVVFLLLDDDPANLIYLRLVMLPFLVLTALAAWRINAAGVGRWALVTPVIVLMAPTWSVMATQIRPDPIAGALFAAALAIHYGRRPGPRWRGFLSGFLLSAAAWTTLKVAYFGLIFPLALAVDLTRRRRERSGYLLSHPGAFVAGVGAVALPVAIYLTCTGSWTHWYEWCIRWSFVHQWHYPGFPWLRNFTPLFAQSFWLFPLAVCGLVSTLRRLGGAHATFDPPSIPPYDKGGRPHPSQAAGRDPDLLLVGALVTTLASFAWQSAAYLYSLIPFTVILCVFAGRGVVVTMGFFRALPVPGVRRFAILLLGAVLLVEAERADVALRKLGATSNDDQQALLVRVGKLTRPGEPVYHIAGGQITRPSVHFFYFFEAVVRKLKYDVFATEVPLAMVEKGCIAYMPTDRFGRLPEPLRRFLVTNFQPYDRELWFWGRRYEVPPGGELRADFLAVRAGRYFVFPPSVLGPGQPLAIAGRPAAAVLDLEAGSYPVAYRGEARELYILWLPASGVPFVPRPELQPPIEPGS